MEMQNSVPLVPIVLPNQLYPRTNLKTPMPWTSFPNDIHQVIQSATTHARLSSAPFFINAWTWTEFVENEEALHAHAKYALHEPVRMVLEKLGVNG